MVLFHKKNNKKKSTANELFVTLDIKDMYSLLQKYDALSEIKNRINDSKFVTSIDKCTFIELAR